nr:methylcrotonoyl-CoA carboxylase [Chloroflexota bacterium]
MDAIESNIQAQSADFQENAKHMRSLTSELAENLQAVRERSDTNAAKLHLSRGKMLVRDRVKALLDPGTPFLEFSPLASWQMYEDDNPCGGIVTGIGMIHGQQGVIVANDATVQCCTSYPITVKKHLRAQEIPLELPLPYIYLVDSGVAVLPRPRE